MPHEPWHKYPDKYPGSFDPTSFTGSQPLFEGYTPPGPNPMQRRPNMSSVPSAPSSGRYLTGTGDPDQILGRVGWPGSQPQGLLGHGEAGGFANPDWTQSSPAFNKYDAPPPDEYVPNIPMGVAGPMHPADPERDPAKYDWEEMTMSDGTSQLVEPLREKELGSGLNWGAFDDLGQQLGLPAPSMNLGFTQQAIQNNPSPWEWEEWQKQRLGMGRGVYGGRNT